MKDWQYFFQKIRHLRLRAEKADKRLRLIQTPTRCYHKDFIASYTEDDAEIRVELTLPGLYGGHGVLPDYFSDQILQYTEEETALRDFMDFFNQRMMEIFYQTWSRYHFFTQDLMVPRTEQAEMESRFLDRLAGIMRESERAVYLRGLRWNRMRLYRQSGRTSTGLLDIITSFFPGLNIEFASFVAQYRTIPEDQLACLGKKPLQIGMNGCFLVGNKFKDMTGGFRLTVTQLDYPTYVKLLPGGAWNKLLVNLVGDYTKNQWECNLDLELKAEEVPAWQLGSRRAGTDMWVRSKPLEEDVKVQTGALN